VILYQKLVIVQWNESVCGRTSNDISSALIILEKIFEKYPNIDSLIL
jgi:hypothetical protein